MNLRQLFDLSLVNRRNGVALEWNGADYTFGDIDARSNRVANAFKSAGLAQGDRVAVYLANRIEMIDIYLACVKLGLIFVPINILYREREMSHILRDAEPKRLITESDLPALAAEAAAQPDRLEALPLEGDAPAALVYTSGTTGTSKGAILTHNNFAANAVNLTGCWQISDHDRFLLALPLFHVHALGNGLHCWLLSGCRMRLLERFDQRTAAATFLDFQPTLFFGVPTVYVRLLETPGDTAREIGRRMRLFVSGSAPLPAQVLEEFREKFGHTILERYGMSETMMNLSNPYAGERRPGSVGFPLPGVSVRIDETGELYLKGPNVFAGYWRREDATREAFLDGWFKTGDIATRSADGYYTLCGRRSDLIISGGFNIYPREIEEFLGEQPEIAEAAVVGEPDRARGEIPVAYIVLKDGACDSRSLEARCREKLASFKVPRRFEVVEQLPRNALGESAETSLVPRVLMVASEAAPFAKTGGLADVLGSLPPALARLGDEVAVLLPLYRGIPIPPGGPILTLPVQIGPHGYSVAIHEAVRRNVRYLFAGCPPLFDRDGIYGTHGAIGGADYPDNDIRFAVLSQAALGVARSVFRPDVFHAHDWQTGLLPVYLRESLPLDPTFFGVRCVFTIHNLGYQGIFPAAAIPELGLDPRLFHPEGLEFFGRLNFLKAGIVWSDAINAVSPTYAREIQTPEFGFGLDGLLRARASKLTGILNGADYEEWNPETDRHLPANYSAGDLSGKRACKLALLDEMGLPAEADRPLIGIVSRFAHQKGMDLVAEIAPIENAALVVLGSGEAAIEDFFHSLAFSYPDRIAVRLGYDDGLAHRIEAGADMFLMPSRYEPCGLNQIYSLRYGTVPIVRATGGLEDTVNERTGFKFRDDLAGAVGAALEAFQDRETWVARMRRGMAQDFSWDASAVEYQRLYSKAPSSRLAHSGATRVASGGPLLAS